MLPYLTAHLGRAVPPPGLRAFGAAATALLLCLALGPAAIAWLRRMSIAEPTEKSPIEDRRLRRRMAAKDGTPTMGGLFLVPSVLASALLWCDLTAAAVVASLLCIGALASLGAADDWRKLTGRGRTDRGLKARHKLALQGLIGAAFAVLVLQPWGGPAEGGVVPPTLPLRVGGPLAALLFAAGAVLLIATMSNSTNLTDGLDGLLAGLALPAAIVVGLACWISNRPHAQELSVLCGALAGGCLGFLRYNRHPARVFMGDCGSLAVGGALACAAVAGGQVLPALVAGAVFLTEFGSSLLQIGFYKLFGRRILPIAPIHHIFEQKGHPEPSIVRGFYVGGALAGAAGLALVYL
ncbi:MAG: phospho-N-acetylmuramoyl-pentapeptide-transferase [Planctomycetota bacterium]